MNNKCLSSKEVLSVFIDFIFVYIFIFLLLFGCAILFTQNFSPLLLNQVMKASSPVPSQGYSRMHAHGPAARFADRLFFPAALHLWDNMGLFLCVAGMTWNFSQKMKFTSNSIRLFLLQ